MQQYVRRQALQGSFAHGLLQQRGLRVGAAFRYSQYGSSGRAPDARTTCANAMP